MTGRMIGQRMDDDDREDPGDVASSGDDALFQAGEVEMGRKPLTPETFDHAQYMGGLPPTPLH